MRKTGLKGAAAVTLCELKRKDVICIGDGRLVGRTCDLAFEPESGRVSALIVCGGGFSSVFHGEKSQITIPFAQVACIGDDVILVSSCVCG
ncbi:MAG: YlmC/YmxH family sporulation protein [Clostridia bacterium]|nr:YlmC/YmxH family sporulation protein [Clostridia bacterium]